MAMVMTPIVLYLGPEKQHRAHDGQFAVLLSAHEPVTGEAVRPHLSDMAKECVSMFRSDLEPRLTEGREKVVIKDTIETSVEGTRYILRYSLRWRTSVGVEALQAEMRQKLERMLMNQVESLHNAEYF